MRFVHTADWQIGKVFRGFGDKEAVLRQARVDAVERIGTIAADAGAHHVLVAGDLYDSDQPLRATLLEPLERMRRFPALDWHIIPGNHDSHRPKGVWDRVREAGLPANVHVHLAPEPADLGGAVLLPAPLTRRSETRDLTEWMDAAPSQPGQIRIGLAHGSVTGFGGEGEAGNPVDPARPARARLDYLALGDWHRTLRVGPNCWYAGTPEADRAGGGQEQGRVLLVDIDGPGATPRVEEIPTGRFHWVTREERLEDEAAIADLDQRLRTLPGLSQTVMRLRLAGALPLSAQSGLDRTLAGLSAAMFSLDVDRGLLACRPTGADLDRLDFDGVLRQAAEQLVARAEDGALDAASRRRAGEALVALHLMAGR